MHADAEMEEQHDKGGDEESGNDVQHDLDVIGVTIRRLLLLLYPINTSGFIHLLGITFRWIQV